MIKKCLKNIRLKNLFNNKKNCISKKKNYSKLDLKHLNFESLWNDFDRRTWHYNNYKQILKKNDERLLNWIGSIDYSGYIRECCLRYLISNFIVGDENRILLRLSDWVPHIRSIAREWVLNNFEVLSFEEISKNYLLILYLARKEVLISDPAMQHINVTLLSKVRTIEKKEFFSLDHRFRKYLFILSLESDQLLRKWLLDDKEPVNRLLLLNHPVCNLLDNKEIIRLKSDKSVFVRRKYLSLQIKKGIRPSQDELIHFSLDRNYGIRDIGRFFLKKYYKIDAYEIYKNKKSDEFFYIADYAKKEDTNYFIQGISSKNKHIRLICLRALSMIDIDKLKVLNAKLLIKDNRKIRTIIYQYLPEIMDIKEIINLREYFIASSSSGIMDYLRVINKKSYWYYINESLNEILFNYSNIPDFYLHNITWVRSNSYEKLSDDLRSSINNKLSLLKKSDSYEKIKGAINYLEFIIKTT